MTFRFLLVLILLFSTQVNASETKQEKAEIYSFVVQPGKQYLVTLVPEKGGDAVFGYSSREEQPFVIVDNFEEGRVEKIRLIPSSEELRVAVYSTEGKPRLSVLDEDQKFPFLKWRKQTSLSIQKSGPTEPTTYQFTKVSSNNESFYADPIPGSIQKVKALSGIRYRFQLKTAAPLDLMVIPETNHVNVAVHIKTGISVKTINEDRNPAQVRETGKGQVEWTQIYPKDRTLDIYVENKSSFAGEFRLVLRQLVEKVRMQPVSWDYLEKPQLEETFEDLLKEYPLINDQRGITFEILPKRDVTQYALEVTSIEPDVNFALVIRTDPKKPPIIVPAGGVRYRSAIFNWDLEGLDIIHPGRESEKSSGFPNFGKLRVFVAGFGGETRLRMKLKDRVTLDQIPIPDLFPVVTESATAMVSNSYKGFGFSRESVNLYKYEVTAGETYTVQVTPEPYFDAAIIDSSKRTYEDPSRLELVDRKGHGSPESILIKPKSDETEFAVAGIRYRNGIVRLENRRFGGTGFYTFSIKDSKGKTPKLKESREIKLPHEFIQTKLNTAFELWDPRPVRKASDLPPLISLYDSRIVDAVRNPRIAKTNQP